MNGTDKVVVQVVMKKPDGSSILTTDATQAGAGDVDPGRAAEIRKLLEDRGFDVMEGNLNTLSVAGTASQLQDFFGIADNAAASGVEAHAAGISPELEDFVADVFVPSPPEMFP